MDDESTERRDDADTDLPADAAEEAAMTPAAGALIAGNLAGVNMGLSTTATGAPSASALDQDSLAEATDEDAGLDSDA